jgi:hypothetical protein
MQPDIVLPVFGTCPVGHIFPVPMIPAETNAAMSRAGTEDLLQLWEFEDLFE